MGSDRSKLFVRSRNSGMRGTDSKTMNQRFKQVMMNRDIYATTETVSEITDSSKAYSRKASILRIRKELDPVYEQQKKIAKNFQSLTQINDAQKKIQERIQTEPKTVYETEKTIDKEMNNRYLQGPIHNIKLLRRIKWDIHSPRFKQAQLKLGFDDEDLILK